MLAQAEKSSHKLTPFKEIAARTKGAISHSDGQIRWLDDKQEIEFDEPELRGANGEFKIKKKPYQKIWFSQLSSMGMDEDIRNALVDVIVFKGQSPCNIRERFYSAQSFWNAVKNKKFRVDVIGHGLQLSKDSQYVVSQRKIAIKRAIQDVDGFVFEQIRSAVMSGNISIVSDALKNKVTYRLTEI